jgi:cell wall-associated NlpC family hydrolase
MMNKILFRTFLILVIVLLVAGCASRKHRYRPPSPVRPKPVLNLMQYTIQAGAFKNVENAARLTERLRMAHGLDATYFRAADKLFKVRFGNFPSKELALARAIALVEAKVIEEFYIVQPEEYAVAREKQYGTDYLRESLVKTAKDFLGVPYLWGGASPDDGFDCSGLTMTVYQLNGLNLPRHSRTQYDVGISVSREHLQQGDLVFFLDKDGNRISHVGIYIGRDQFIHASSQGKKIRIDSLSSDYFARHFLGGKTYL